MEEKIVEDMKQLLGRVRTDPFFNSNIDISTWNSIYISRAIDLFKSFKGTPEFNKKYLMEIIMNGTKGQTNPKIADELINDAKIFE